MKVWVIKSTYGSYEDTYTDIACVVDSEEKANAFVEKKEQEENSVLAELERCRECTLTDDIDNFIFTCLDAGIEPDGDIINKKAREYKQKNKCQCSIRSYMEDDYALGVVCDHCTSLSLRLDMAGYYNIVPMEVQ